MSGDTRGSTPPDEPPAAKLDAMCDRLKSRFADVPEVTAQELYGWLQQATKQEPAREAAGAGPAALPPVVVDVRTAEEQQVSMLPGPGTVTQQEFEARGPEAFKGRRVVCYCTAGYRSGYYARRLREEHGLDAFNLRGSILSWTQAGLPLTDPRDGSTTNRVHVFSSKWAMQGDGYTPVAFEWPMLSLAQDTVGSWGRSLFKTVTGSWSSSSAASVGKGEK